MQLLYKEDSLLSTTKIFYLSLFWTFCVARAYCITSTTDSQVEKYDIILHSTAGGMEM